MKLRSYIRVGGEVKKSIKVELNIYKQHLEREVEKRNEKEIQQQIYNRYGMGC